MTIYQTDFYANNPANFLTGSNRIDAPIMQVPELKAALIIPGITPFYAKDFKVWHRAPGVTGEGTLLQLGIDYFFGAEFRAATRSTQHQIYSMFFLTDHTKRGSVRIQMRVLGTDWSRDVNFLYQRLVAQSIHPRKTTYENISELPIAFPVIQHPHPVEEMYYTEDFINSMNNIATAINNRPNDTVAQVYNLLFNNLTKAQVQLGNVPNFSAPTAGIITAGTSTVHFATINAVSQIVERRLADMGFGGQTSPGQPQDLNAITSSVTTAVDSELVIFDGSTGKVIKSTLGKFIASFLGNKPTLTLRTGANGTPGSFIVQEPGGSGRSIELVFPMAFSGGASYAVNMPGTAGTLLNREQLLIPAGTIPYNSGATSGLPSGNLAMASAPTPLAVVRFDSNGRFTVGTPTADDQPINKAWADAQYLTKTDPTVFKTTSLIAANAQPSTTTAYHSTAVQALISNLVTHEELNDIIADIVAGETGASGLTITQITANVASQTYNLIADTYNVVNVSVAGTILRFPTGMPVDSVIGIAIASLGAGQSVTVNTVSQILGTAVTSFTLRTTNEYVYFQSTSDGKWVLVNHGEYFAGSKNNASITSRFRGEYNALPDSSTFDVGNYFKLTATVAGTDGNTWRAGGMVYRTATGWTYSAGSDMTDLNDLYDILITGFTNVNAAL